MTEAEAARLIALDQQLTDAKNRILEITPPPPIRPYIPEVIVTLLDGQQFVVACDSLIACAQFAEFVMISGYREANPDGFLLFPPSQVKWIRTRKRMKET